MKAVGLTKYLPIENLASLMDFELPKPKATGRDVLVNIHAIAVNPVDTKIRKPKDKIESEPKILCTFDRPDGSIQTQFTHDDIFR